MDKHTSSCLRKVVDLIPTANGCITLYPILYKAHVSNLHWILTN